MALDRYALCPGGTGKKIKFCCADLTAELEHIQRSLEGEQRLAALERVRKARAQFGDRACLLSIQCLLEDDLNQGDQHAATLAAFTEKFPDNPVTLAETALTRAETDGPQAGVEPLQRAIAASSDHMPGRVFEAISILGRLLVGRGFLMAGRAHLLLELALSGGRSESTISLLARLSRAEEVPLLIKDDHHLKPAPAGFAAAKGYQEAMQQANRGAWLAAAQRFEQFSAVAAGVPEVWHNLGLLKAYVADQAGAEVALRKLAALPVPPDDAIEAEALAQLLSTANDRDLVDVVAATWTIADAADVQTRLGGADRALRIAFDPASLAGSEEPPPLALFRLTDRATPKAADSLSRENVPNVLGQLAVFGRQTDREARIELIATRGAEFEAARQVLSELLAQPLGFPEKEEVVRRTSPIQQAMTWRWHLPADITSQQRADLTRKQHRHVIVDVWPTLPNPVLGGKTPRDAAADPGNRIALSALVLNLELASSGVEGDGPIAELREQLGLTAPQPIDPTGLDLKALPAPRLARLEVEKLSDNDLIDVYRRAAWLHFVPAMKRLAEEVIRRPSLENEPNKIDKAEAHGLLAEIAEDSAERMRHISSARQVAEKRGESSAPWDLSELAVALEQGDEENFQRLLAHIRDQHLQEPGVGEALMNLLAQAGLIPAGGAGMPPEMAMAGAPPPSPAAKIWTPGGDAPAPAGGKKSVIWTPGS